MNKFIKVVLLLFLIYRISIRRFWKRQNRGGARTTWLYEKHISKSHIQLTFAWLNSFCIYPCLKIIQIRCFFLVLVFLHSDWIWRYTLDLSVFSSNAGKYRSEKAPCLDTFHAVYFAEKLSTSVNKLKLTSSGKILIRQ